MCQLVEKESRFEQEASEHWQALELMFDNKWNELAEKSDSCNVLQEDVYKTFEDFAEKLALTKEEMEDQRQESLHQEISDMVDAQIRSLKVDLEEWKNELRKVNAGVGKKKVQHHEVRAEASRGPLQDVTNDHDWGWGPDDVSAALWKAVAPDDRKVLSFSELEIWGK